jgi:adenosylcobinamide kinase/adenosylcobinamide-phosphate guanylyltransferase
MRVVFITGGARSGKSLFAVGEAAKVKGRKAYIATAEALDDEMAERIAAHRKDRSGAWDTIEEPTELSGVIREAARDYDVIVIDCLTLWLSNILCRNPRTGEEAAAGGTAALVQTLLDLKRAGEDNPCLYVIANEVGMGIVPSNRTARRFRDLAGRLNQLVAEVADEVFLMISGLPVKVKG